jgi:AAA family ATP:ADP antiporter
MILEKLRSIKTELFSLSRTEKIFILCAMLTSFCICAEYALVRPVANSLFITFYGAKALPYAWIAIIPLNFILVSLYNRLLSKYSCLQILSGTVALIALGNVLGALFLKQSPFLAFFLYIWKDIYILLLFQQLWSVIHSTISSKRARYLYGVIFSVGAVGSIFGSMIPGLFAVSVGSETLLYFSLPLCFGLVFFYAKGIQHSTISSTLPPSTTRGFLEGIRQIQSSKALTLILLLVVFMQLAATILDYQFNISLEASIPQKDLRTQFTGRILGCVHLSSFFLQIIGSYLLLSFFGLRRAHFFVPFVLLGNAILALIYPVLGSITFSYMTIKSFDFSLYHIIKEMLYIPLRQEEKFRAKSFIDVFAARSSKALASFCILLLQIVQWYIPLQLSTAISMMLILIFTLWLFTLFSLYKESIVPEVTI